jgi:hypothetical protein
MTTSLALPDRRHPGRCIAKVKGAVEERRALMP